mmetsp:Transcript_6426/g.17973  ORF Transcript_6426/g.17973 Transcript_6426/m.17973 type:complete len:92 (+) Transcript_6426:168-443(+)
MNVMLAVDGSLRHLLVQAQDSKKVEKSLRERAKQYTKSDAIPFRDAQEICVAVRSAQGGQGPWLHELAKGGKILLPSPPERVKVTLRLAYV